VPLAIEGSTWDVRGPRDIAERLLAQIGDLTREELWVLTMDVRLAVLDVTPLYRGSVSASLVRVAEIFSCAISLPTAAAVAIAHVHPSGHVDPSEDDLYLTSQVVKAGQLLDVRVVDHLILGRGGSWTSLRDRGINFERATP
jgi:DNA repair protein RadC